jgi:uncharacterized repeat protein (TIGR01451 family)
MLKLRFIPSVLIAVLLAAFHLPAQAAAGQVELKSIAEREVETVTNGKKEIRRAPVNKAVPGDEIIYTTIFRNLAGKPVGDIVITNPVPNDSLYKADSASGANAVITFSVDGGKQYAAPGQLTVKTKDGKTRAALPSDYTHIRWTYKGELGAGKSGEVSFRAFIK